MTTTTTNSAAAMRRDATRGTQPRAATRKFSGSPHRRNLPASPAIAMAAGAPGARGGAAAPTAQRLIVQVEISRPERQAAAAGVGRGAGVAGREGRAGSDAPLQRVVLAVRAGADRRVERPTGRAGRRRTPRRRRGRRRGASRSSSMVVDALRLPLAVDRPGLLGELLVVAVDSLDAGDQADRAAARRDRSPAPPDRRDRSVVARRARGVVGDHRARRRRQRPRPGDPPPRHRSSGSTARRQRAGRRRWRAPPSCRAACRARRSARRRGRA